MTYKFAEMINENRAILNASVIRITDVLISFEGISEIDNKFHENITRLYDELYNMNKLLAVYLNLDSDELLKDMANVTSQRDIFSDFSIQLEKIEPTLCDVVDLLENDEAFPIPSQKLDTTSIAQLIEECNKINLDNQSKLTSIKEITETYLDFKEISENHIKSLDDIIKEGLNQLFEIFEIQNSSPIRHYPSFTLEKITKLLSKDNTNRTISSGSSYKMHGNEPNIEEQPKFPIFTGTDANLSKKFLQLQKKLNPIEKSLMELLPKRIESFDTRSFKFINDLLIVLNKRYDEVMVNYRYLNQELQIVKLELIDNRWNYIFAILNKELIKKISNIEHCYKVLNSNNFTPDIKLKLRQKLNEDTNTISRTFNVIYKALEFSLLRTDIASETNKLAEEWINLRELTDVYLLATPNLSDDKARKIVLTRRERSTNNALLTDLDFFKPPQFTNFDARDANSTDDEQDSGNLTIQSIANDLRQFSLASNLNKQDKTSNTNTQPVMKKMTKPLIIPSITSSTSGTTMSSEVLDSLTNDTNEESNPFFDTTVKFIESRQADGMVLTTSMKSANFFDRLESPNNIIEALQSCHLDDNNSDFGSDLESSRIDHPLKNPKKIRSERSQISTINNKSSFDDDFELGMMSTNDLKKNITLGYANMNEEEVTNYETAKLKYYASQRSKIPRIILPNYSEDSKYIPPPPTASVLHTPPRFSSMSSLSSTEKHASTIYSSRRKLRQPTLMSQLLTPSSRH